MATKAVKQQISVVDSVLTCEYPTIGKKFVRKLTDYPKAVYIACESADHGMKQKFGDAESGGTAAEKYLEILEIDEALMDGDWKRTGDRGPSSILCEAIARLKKLPFEKVRDAVREASEVQVREWHDHPEIKLKKHQIRAERLTALAKDAPDFEFKI
jgi:hypothetical protein